MTKAKVLDRNTLAFVAEEMKKSGPWTDAHVRALKAFRTAWLEKYAGESFCEVEYGRWLQGADAATLQEMLDRPDVLEVFVVIGDRWDGDVTGWWNAAVGVMSPKVTE